MNVITSTELRTKMPDVVATLLQGGTIDLIHRSKIIGAIMPKKKGEKQFTKEDIKTIQALAKKSALPKLSYKDRERLYRKRLLGKYGKDIS
ncbi:hypothetical protein HY945_05505 [Candidatus Gottesmanbacteria bacterium]|nr:hypothetical protein [Candidatus Gottesmanbacteria bacterium]